jgi:hypothetical protein
MTALDPGASVRAALRPGGLEEILATGGSPWPAEPDSRLAVEVTRVGRLQRAYVIHCTVRAGMEARDVIVQFVSGDVDALAARETESLRKRRRNQLGRSEVGFVAVPSHGALVQRAGLDRRIWALGMFGPLTSVGDESHRFGADLMAPLVGDRYRLELLAHRLAKRATIRVAGPDRSVIAKAYKARSDVPPRVAAWSESLAVNAPRVPIPRSLGCRPDRALIVMSDLGAGTASEFGQLGQAAAVALPELLSILHDHALLAAPVHRPEHEAEVLGGAIDLLRVARPDAAAALAGPHARVAQRLADLDAVAPVPIHRDVHPGQVHVDGGGTAHLLDLDTVSLGDPMLDLGNIAAYLDLAGQTDTAEGIVEAYRPDSAGRGRLGVWRQAARLRLVAIKLLNRVPVDRLVRDPSGAGPW